MKVFYFHTKV